MSQKCTCPQVVAEVIRWLRCHASTEDLYDEVQLPGLVDKALDAAAKTVSCDACERLRSVAIEAEAALGECEVFRQHTEAGLRHVEARVGLVSAVASKAREP